ncbi:MAG TPA: hypothetical protein VEI94_05230 [Candidatus Bathyarchaeia archaeon]|nr:hypothetical protein [Candidatus Bathyarchaeia archaeon]
METFGSLAPSDPVPTGRLSLAPEGALCLALLALLVLATAGIALVPRRARRRVHERRFVALRPRLLG